MADSNYFIVSCDGGGIRGLVTAMLLEDLDSQIPGFLDKVAFFAGTSTGGIIALGLAAGVPISKICHMYQSEAATIFAPYRPGIMDLLGYVREYVDQLLEPGLTETSSTLEGMPNFSDEFKAIEDVFHVKYEADGLTSVLQATLPSTRTLNQIRPVMVSTYVIAPVNQSSWQPLLLTNLPSPPNTDVTALDASTISVIDAALATSAAPTFFPPHNISSIGYCSDGGLFANNPSQFALMSAIAQDNPVENIYMLSLGTGTTPQKVNQVADALAWGAGQWLLPRQTSNVPQLLLLETLMDGQEAIADSQCARVLSNRYKRVDIQLSQLFSLDDITSIPKIIQETQAYIEGKSAWAGVPAWTDVVSWAQASI